MWAILKVFFHLGKEIWPVSETFSDTECGNGQHPKYELPEEENRNFVS
jgi:hypothetical protein